MVRTVLTVLVAAAAAASSPAAAATPCWQRLIDDYSDGRIDRTYPVACYSAALAHLPEDVRVYSSAEEDIHRALLASVAQRPTRRSGVKGVRTKATVVAPNARRIQAVSRTVKSQRPRPDVGSTRAITRAARSDNEVSSSIPLPVLVSAVGGAVLVTAGAASALRRRLSR